MPDDPARCTLSSAYGLKSHDVSEEATALTAGRLDAPQSDPWAVWTGGGVKAKEAAARIAAAEEVDEAMSKLSLKLISDPLVEKRSFLTCKAHFNGTAEQYPAFRTEARKFLDREPWIAAILNGLEKWAVMEDEITTMQTATF